MNPERLPVVIVGAGPAGACLALLLAERGVPVTLVEASRDLARQFRGEALMPSGLEALEQLGLMPLLEQLPRRPLDGWSFHLDGRELFRVEEPLDGGRRCTLVSQPALLEAILERAQSWPDFRWLPGQPVRDLLVHRGRVAGVRLAGGRRLPALLVIGSDGRSSTVRTRAGLALDRSSSPIDLLWFRLPEHPSFLSDNVFTQLLGRGGACSVFHGARAGELQLGWVVDPGERIERSGPAWAETFAGLAPAWLAAHFRREARALSAPIALTVQVGLGRCWHRPGLLLLGDAAHPMSPIRAQGINMALRDTIVAANRLMPALRANSPGWVDAMLATVQAEREPDIRRAQELQRLEASQGLLLRQWPWLRQALLGSPLPVRRRLRHRWLTRQRPLRHGLGTVRLTV